VCVDTDGSIKRLAKKNLLLVPPPAPVLVVPSPQDQQVVFIPGSSSVSARRGSGAASSQVAIVPAELPVTLGPTVTKDLVRRAADKAQRDIAALRAYCGARARGRELAGEAITDVFMRMYMSHDTFSEISVKYIQVFGQDEELKGWTTALMELFEEVDEVYRNVRSWTELAQDEWNLTHYSIRKHGVVGTLKNELVETGKDVVDLTKDTHELVSTASRHVAPLVRQGTATFGTVVQTGTRTVSTTAGALAQRGQQSATSAMEERLVGPVKRMWTLLLTGFLLCWILPLFALRAFAPFNSVVSNVGLVYLFCVLFCPPAWAKGRKAKAGLLVAWPLLTVLLPLVLHYWVMNPEACAQVWAAMMAVAAWFSRAIAALGDRAVQLCIRAVQMCARAAAAVRDRAAAMKAGEVAAFMCRRGV